MKIIIGAYFVVQILILSSLMVLEIKLTLHSVMMALSCALYVFVSFKKPGYFKSNIKVLQLSDELKHKPKNNQKSIVQIDQVDSGQQKDSDQHIQNKTNKSPKINQNLHNQEGQLDQIQKHKSLNNIQMKNEKLKKQSKKQNKIKTNCAQRNTKSLSIQKRYCKICLTIQPERVRHCHQCNQCILTFDHHCPWMDVCIGQKNRSYFWTFLLIQFIQFLCVDVSILNAISDNKDLKHFYFFFMALLLITFISLGIFIFHTYLAFINLTTWEYVRWDKIQYLKDNEKYISPFSYGWKNNIYDFYISSWQNQPFEWIINNQEKAKITQNKNISGSQKKKKQIKIKIVKQEIQTERKISKPNQTIPQY